MDFSLSPEQQQIRDEVRKLCLQFDDAYWLDKDRSGDFPHELHGALAAAGWLGIAMPEEYGGAGLGITESGSPPHKSPARFSSLPAPRRLKASSVRPKA
jgi:acyl-CoA dehydrogenase